MWGRCDLFSTFRLFLIIILSFHFTYLTLISRLVVIIDKIKKNVVIYVSLQNSNRLKVFWKSFKIDIFRKISFFYIFPFANELQKYSAGI